MVVLRNRDGALLLCGRGRTEQRSGWGPVRFGDQQRKTDEIVFTGLDLTQPEALDDPYPGPQQGSVGLGSVFLVTADR